MPRIFFALLLFFAITPAFAGEQTPLAFVQWIYSHYQGSDHGQQGVFLDKPSEVRRYFAPPLADRIIADDAAAARRDEVPALDSDPFIDAQDWEITGIAIHIDSQDARAAHATVRFENFKKPQTVRLDLVRTPAGWRVSEVTWPGDEGTLGGLYKKQPAQK